MNFYPFHIGDYISHTSHLSDEEDLAYRRMIDLYYLNEAPFEPELHLIARKIKSNPEVVDVILNEFFVFEDGKWHNKRADLEIAKYQFVKESGKKGAEKRWANREEKPSQCPPNSPPNATPIATKTITKTITNTNNKDIPIPEGMNIVVWNDYLKLRKGQKKPLTETALKGLQREADKADMTLVKALEICCERGWIGFKADWIKDKESSIPKQSNKMSNFWAQIEGVK
jgi:uncharacterized protein YdaU (DUF1376 family)